MRIENMKTVSVGLMSVITVLFVLLSIGCSSTAPQWESKHQIDHPLVGTITEVKSKKVLQEHELVSRLLEADIILFGESHINKDHHRLQRHLIEQLLHKREAGAFLLEHLIAEQAETLNSSYAQNPEKALTAEDIEWSKGWDDWSWYQPMIQAWQASSGVIGGASFPRKKAFSLVMQPGQDIVPAERAEALGYNSPLSEGAEQRLKQQIEESHCGHADPNMVKGMVKVQRVRDALMTDRLLTQSREGKINLLLAGNGHIRADWGVPYYLNYALSRSERALKIATVAWLEVSDGDTQLVDIEDNELFPADYIWWTPVADDRDPCELYRDQLEKMRKGRK